MGAQSEMPGIRQRGGTFYAYFRVPARYRAVEPLQIIDRSLRTTCTEEARERLIVLRRTLKRGWDERLDQRDRIGRLNGVEIKGPADARQMHQAALALLDDWRIPYRPIEEVAASPLNDLLDRLRKLQDVDLSSNAVPALLGTLDLPATPISRMPQEFERISARILTAKSPRQRREWRNKYLRAAQIFVELRGDKAMTRITDEDAMAIRRHWIRRRNDGVSTAYANKQLAYLKQMVDGFYEDLDVPPDRRTNPFKGVKLPESKHGPHDRMKARPTLPEAWIHTVLYDANRVAGLNDEARDIAWISAETGARQSEIYNAPATDFRLDHEIPHMIVRSITDGPERREIKNQASERTIVLLGRALEAARRHPGGFPRYRGNGNFSGTLNKFFRDGELFPPDPDGGRRFTLGGLRHAFEARMKIAGLDNEERAFMMGHSVEAIRGRPVYGAELSLSLRSLYQEMVSFPTSSWTPRPAEELWELIYRSLEIEGYRSRGDVGRRLSH